MIDNTADKDVVAAVACVHHMRQVNPLRAEWMAEYGIKTEFESMPDVEDCEVEEEILTRIRQYRSRDLD